MGVAGPFSDPNAAFGMQLKNGASLAIADINAAGGILGQKIEVMIGDDVSDPREAVSLANKFASQGVKFVIGHFNSGTTIPASEVYRENGILVIPDVLANAGGAIVSYFEWAQNLQHFGWDEREVNDRLAARMRRAYGEVAERSRAGRTSMRVAAYELGISRVVEAGRLRRHRGYV